MLLLVLRLSRGLLLLYWCCALLLCLAGLGDWCTTTDSLLSAAGLRTRGTIMQSCLDESGPEGLALLESERKLLLGGLSAAVGTGESTSTPGGATANLSEVGESAEDGLVAERNKDHAVVDEGRHGADDGGLLTTAGGGSGNESTGVLAPEGTSLPLATLMTCQYVLQASRCIV